MSPLESLKARLIAAYTALYEPWLEHAKSCGWTCALDEPRRMPRWEEAWKTCALPDDPEPLCVAERAMSGEQVNALQDLFRDPAVQALSQDRASHHAWLELKSDYWSRRLKATIVRVDGWVRVDGAAELEFGPKEPVSRLYLRSPLPPGWARLHYLEKSGLVMSAESVLTAEPQSAEVDLKMTMLAIAGSINPSCIFLREE